MQRMSEMHQKDARAAQRDLRRQATSASATSERAETSQKAPEISETSGRQEEAQDGEQQGTDTAVCVRYVAAVPPDVVTLR